MRERTHWIAVAAALLAGIVGGALNGKMPTALPLLQDEFALSLIAAGWLVAMFNLVGVSGAIFFGLISDRIGALRFCLFGVATEIVGGLLGAAAPDAATLIASRVVESVGFIAIAVSAPSLIAAASAARERGLALGLWGTYLPAGSAIAVALSPLAIGTFGWRGLWLAVVVVAVAVGVLLLAQTREYREVRSGSRRSLANVTASLAQPVPWLLGAVFALYTSQFIIVMVWLPTYLLETRAATPTAAALLTAAYIVANAFGNVLGSWFVHRNVPRGRVIRNVFLLTTPCFLGMFAPELSDGTRFALALAYGFITGSIPPSVFSGAVRYARSSAEVGILQGLIVQLSNVGGFAGPPIAAAVVTWAGAWDAAHWVLIGAGLAGIAVALVILRHERLDAGA